ncbi:MAG: GDP-mannose 4,6-dehydratase [Candidatus Curtissbacteria bacterium]|nr:GDP-mannose 4,6-dehydratase [Candidatus Curtissbacteria bacterium]
MHKILVTGCAGFVGSTLVERLLGDGHAVVGIDNFNNYYDPQIKERNLDHVLGSKNFKLFRADILDFKKLTEIFKVEKFDKIIHLAARAGVRPSIEDPLLYSQVNVLGTTNLLKAASDMNVKQFIFGSSSSVYGNSKQIPFTEDDLCENIVSPYGASKRAAEFFARSFHKNFGLKIVILRFFTVYGPKGRVDMAPSLFTNAILEDKPIIKFGEGDSSRDYTYIDDIIDGIVKTLETDLDFEIINLGNSNPVSLNEFIETLEKLLSLKAVIKNMPMQNGDVENTWANIVKAKKLLGWEPKVQFTAGLTKYVEWLRAQ